MIKLPFQILQRLLLVVVLGAAVACDSVTDAAPNAGGDRAEAELTDKELIHRFRKFWHKDGRQTSNSTYLGVETLQNPLDVWITYEIIFEVKPDVIVETGTYRGGSALLWATFLERINPDGKVITIDYKDHRVSQATERPIWKRRIEFLQGSSTAPKIITRVAESTKNKKTLFILDSDHRERHVLAELNAYAPMVSQGSYIIVQDTALGGIKAVRRFLADNDHFEVDLERERYILTNNINGFLKRIK